MANNLVRLGPLEESVVREMANIGLGHAATALADMTGRVFEMSIPKAEMVPLEEVPSRVDSGEFPTVGIYMPIDGQIGGHIAFLLPWNGAKALWTMLLGESPASPEEVSELHASMMMEIGNIINGSFLSAISDMTGIDMQATPPQLCIDMLSTVLDAIVVQAAFGDHAALTVETVLADEGKEMEGFFVFIPTVEGLRTVFSALGVAEAA